MKTTPMVLSRRAGAGVAIGALVLSGLVIASPAQAVTFKTITDLTINTDETRATGHNEFTADGVHVYTEGNTSTDKAAGYFLVGTPLATAGEPSMTWIKDPAQISNLRPSIQLVVDYNGDGSADGILVGESTYADGTPLYGDDWWLSNGSKAAFKAIAPSHTGGSGSENHGTLDQWRAAAPNAKILKSGWSLGSGAEGNGVIKQIQVGDVKYRFALAETNSAVINFADVDQSDTRSAGHNVFGFTPGGVRVYTDNNTSEAKAAGYFAIDAPLEGLGEPKLDFDATEPAVPGNQLVVDFDNDGTTDGILVGEPVYGNDWWLSNGSKSFVKENAPSHSGGFGSDNHGKLGQWRDAFPDAQVAAAGWSLGSGVKGDGVINSITVGATTYTFVRNKVASTTTYTTSPTTIKVFHNVKINATVVAPGATLTNGRVYVYDGSTKIGSGLLASNGKVTIALASKLKAGKHSIKVKFMGTSSAITSQTTKTITVTK